MTVNPAPTQGMFQTESEMSEYSSQTARNSKNKKYTHAIYLDQTFAGVPRVSVTLARNGRRGGGRRIKTLSGPDRDIAYRHLSTVLWNYRRKTLRTVEDDLPPGEYHPITEACAIQMTLLMEAVKAAPNRERASSIAAAVASMHNSESAWWYACHKNRSRPRKVLQAMHMMYA